MDCPSPHEEVLVEAFGDHQTAGQQKEKYKLRGELEKEVPRCCVLERYGLRQNYLFLLMPGLVGSGRLSTRLLLMTEVINSKRKKNTIFF
jgi:hypothetical protein